MNTLILVAVLGQTWTYSSFAADHKPKAAPAASVAQASPTPRVVVSTPEPPAREANPAVCPNPDCACAPGRCPCISRGGNCHCAAPAPPPPVVSAPAECPADCRCAHTVKAEAKVEAPPPSAAPQRWRLADATGQVWEWTNREELILWVKARNYQAPAQAQAAPQATTTSQSFYFAPQSYGGQYPQYGGMPMYGSSGTCASGQCPN